VRRNRRNRPGGILDKLEQNATASHDTAERERSLVITSFRCTLDAACARAALFSQATLPGIDAFKGLMGWHFKWVSSYGSDFNYDFHVSFRPNEIEEGRGLFQLRNA
jgi:predicted dithiol-disulfide oxidoreductase (DUF899 family)